LKVEFDVKYGNNVVAIPLGNGTFKFNVKYGTNIIEIPNIESSTIVHKIGLTDLWGAKVTIYNDIPDDGVNKRRFDRFVIENCNIQGGYVEKSDGTIQNLVNAKTIVTRDVAHYKSLTEYKKLPADEKDKFFTVNANDFIVLGVVDDVVTTSKEFQQLQEKYKDYGISVTSVSPYIFGMSIDNVIINNA
jgi:hypothetical protein